jgi:hypothetical protein
LEDWRQLGEKIYKEIIKFQKDLTNLNLTINKSMKESFNIFDKKLNYISVNVRLVKRSLEENYNEVWKDERENIEEKDIINFKIIDVIWW